MTNAEQNHLDALIEAEKSAWDAARAQRGIPTENAEWKAAANAQGDFRKQVGEDWATKFEDCYRYRG